MTGLWNPKGVVELDRLFPLKNECAARLLSDVSTGEAWDYLQNNAHNRSYFDKFIPYYLRSYARPRNDALRQIPELDPFLELGLPEDLKDKILNIDDCYSPYAYGYEKSDLTIFDNLAAALYGEMVFEYGNSPPFGNISQVRRWAKPCFDAASLCELYLQSDATLRMNPEISAALIAARNYLRNKGEERLMRYNVRIVARSNKDRSALGDDKLRGEAMYIFSLVEKYFGPFRNEHPHAVVARFLIVGWGLEHLSFR